MLLNPSHFIMKRRPFYLLPSSMRGFRRVRFAASCLVLLAATAKPTLGDSASLKVGAEVA
jgi:hypothetical protein